MKSLEYIEATKLIVLRYFHTMGISDASGVCRIDVTGFMTRETPLTNCFKEPVLETLASFLPKVTVDRQFIYFDNCQTL